MLFDLRAPGRRRTIKVIYATLAVLMGLGLVMFGIGGEVAGGLFDGLGIGGGSTDNQAEERVEQAEKRIQTQPRNAQAWADLTRARYQLVASGENYDQNTGSFTEEGIANLQSVSQAWQRYLELDPEQPDANVAAVMAIAYGPTALNDPKLGARAQAIVAEDRPSSSAYYTLATYYYLANQQRQGDLAGERAVDLAPESQRKQVREQVDQLKQAVAQQQQQQLQQQVQQQGGGLPGITP